MKEIWEFLKGRKTYIVCAVTVIYAVVVVGISQNNWSAAIDMILAALGGASLRHGMNQ